MANASVVGGVLLALIEGMNIMITKMFAQPPPPTRAELEAAMKAENDPTAPPITGGLFPSMGFGGGVSPQSPPTVTEPPVEAAPVLPGGFGGSMSDGTTFVTENSTSASDSSSGDSSSGKWWPFSSSNS